MKTIVIIVKTIVILIIASVALNVGFLKGGKLLHNAVYGNPCKYSPATIQPANDDGKAELVRIAKMLDVKTSGKSMSTLSDDICGKLESSAKLPPVFEEVDFEKMSKGLNPIEKNAMRDYLRFISDLQGKRVIVIEPEE